MISMIALTVPVAFGGVLSEASGKAGGLPLAGPSKGPVRKRKDNQTGINSYGAAGERERNQRRPRNNTLPELSNSVSPPAEPGGYLGALMFQNLDPVPCPDLGFRTLWQSGVIPGGSVWPTPRGSPPGDRRQGRMGS